ncbi:MAG TPA: roadblock/LC7 domain-containing protein [Mycobacteriales bacterium]|nr:roadblock/LC7 domain-containing protein [Mycobacteriales bacterium]
MSDLSSRSQQLDRVIADLLAQAPEVEAAAVVSFDGLPMASALPAAMDEDRVAAMSASLLSLGERAAEGLGRGGLNQVYIEGDSGTVFLVSADDEAVLVAVAASGAKVGMMLYEVRRAAESVAEVLRNAGDAVPAPAPYEAAPAPAEYPAAPVAAEVPAYVPPVAMEPAPYAPPVEAFVKPVAEAAADTQPLPAYAPLASDPAWASSLTNGSPVPVNDQQNWA